MQTLAAKEQILENAGFQYSFRREIYVNRRSRKVFSIDFIENHSEEELQESIAESVNGSGWHFYFNSPPPEGVKRELEAVLG
jgi:ABC-type transporter lipoprotein component MlaA